MAPAQTAEHRAATPVIVAWRDRGERADADVLVGRFRGDLTELALDLGVLYADDQATQAIEAALHVVNPLHAPATWRRRNPGVSLDDWEQAPLATFQSLCIHALLDNAGVPNAITGAQARMSVAHRAALRLQAADVHDLEDAAAWCGIDEDEVAAVWAGETVAQHHAPGLHAPGRRDSARPDARPARRRVAVGAGVGSGLFGGFGTALAQVGAGAVAVTAVGVGVSAGVVAVQRSGPVPTVEAPAEQPGLPVGDPVGDLPGDGGVVPSAPVERVEAPLAPGDVRPGLNLPNVPVDEITLEDVLPDGVTVDPDLLPDVPVVEPGDLPTELPVPTELPTDLLTDLPVNPGDLASEVDDLLAPVEDVVDDVLG